MISIAPVSLPNTFIACSQIATSYSQSRFFTIGLRKHQYDRVRLNANGFLELFVYQIIESQTLTNVVIKSLTIKQRIIYIAIQYGSGKSNTAN